VFKRLIPITMAILTAGGLAACNNADDRSDHGGGGGDSRIEGEKLPESNDVNPPLQPDTYIDEESRRKGEAQDKRAP
jgi:hypothetical protein